MATMYCALAIFPNGVALYMAFIGLYPALPRYKLPLAYTAWYIPEQSFGESVFRC